GRSTEIVARSLPGRRSHRVAPSAVLCARSRRPVAQPVRGERGRFETGRVVTGGRRGGGPEPGPGVDAAAGAPRELAHAAARRGELAGDGEPGAGAAVGARRLPE